MKKHVEGQSPFDTNALFSAMRKAQRNYGRDGIAATALSAIDIALWDLKAKLLEQTAVQCAGADAGWCVLSMDRGDLRRTPTSSFVDNLGDGRAKEFRA